MPLFKVLSFVVCILASSVGIASAQQLDGSIRLPNVTPFKPTLSVDKDPELCSQFKAAWMEVFDGETGLDEGQVDLKTALSNVEFLDPPKDKSFVGYYSEASASVDYDNDGDEEIFYAEAYHHRGIYTGTKYYLYETRAEFESEDPGQISNQREIPGPRFRYNSVKDSKAKLLADYRKIKAGAVFKKDGKLIAQSGNAAKSNQVSLDWLQVDETPQPICTLKLRGPITSPMLYHGMDEEAAKATAEFGYRYLLDNIFYGRTQGAGFGFKVEEPFGPETPLDEIAEQAVEIH